MEQLFVEFKIISVLSLLQLPLPASAQFGYPHYHPCFDVHCSPGTVCVEHQVQCFAPPCYPVPSCVPISSRDRDEAGVTTDPCANMQCPSDRTCFTDDAPLFATNKPGVQGYCVRHFEWFEWNIVSLIVKFWRLKALNPPSCFGVICGFGLYCVITPTNACPHPPCQPVPQCVPKGFPFNLIP